MIKISKGLDLPITGAPEQRIDAGPKARTVAVVGFDYVGMKPTMEVAVGDRVKTGQLLFTDKKTEGVRYTAPATGVVSAINRGERRVLQSVVIDVEDDEYIDFGAVSAADLPSIGEDRIRATLAESGLWCALRTRPFSKVPATSAKAEAIFVNAMDTRPLAGDPAVVIAEYREDFANGLLVLAQLSPTLYVCKAPGADIPAVPAAQVEEFAGPHPAGLPGTHVHFLAGASSRRSVWTINYQDVIAIGKLFTTGKLWTDRVVALAGSQVDVPRLLKTRLGVHLDELVAGQVAADDNRVISGSVLGGRTARGPVAYLGRYHLQVTVLKESTEREFMGWLSPGIQKHSALKIYLSQFSPKRLFNFTTTTNGSERAMVPMGTYENVMPLDILPTQLLRALIVGDTQTAQALGCLELDEEDLALCTYVCPGKYEYGPILRENLTRIEHEG
ncbi:MAG TPA: NADH:ubiquinone reductase (Na(+)-transporting) subunit A [Spongiibacteraceae bacterium]|nr:NADH:ubiquinone reductase (Na(+)-transporting) subunit A [Spongiibacteraceae bacterium]HCS27062.1 NADH:ubiquinone reductase (Na(+)-transporting) subunit A [Spongiibacteraceae bacterium]